MCPTSNNSDSKLMLVGIFERNPKLFIDLISKHYSLNESIIDKYGHKLNWIYLSQSSSIRWREELIIRHFNSWYGFGLCKNESIGWTSNIVDLFKNQWFWDELSENEKLPWSIDLIEKYKYYWNWYNLSSNKGIPWSLELLEKFEDMWQWNNLSENKSIPFCEDLFLRFMKKWNLNSLSFKHIKISTAFIEQNHEVIDWNFLSKNIDLQWSVELLSKYESKWNWGILSSNPNLAWTEEFIDKFENKLNWVNLSCNPNLPWTEKFIDKYKDLWDWQYLSENIGLPWEEELIEKYKNLWNWRILSSNKSVSWSNQLVDKYNTKWDWDYISINKSIFWTKNLLDQYQEYVDWDFLSGCNNVEWSIDIIKKYRKRWYWGLLVRNENIPWSPKNIEDFEFELDNEYNLRNANMPTHLLWSYEKYAETDTDWRSLCNNKSFPWTDVFIDKFKDKLNWEDLAQNSGVKWTIELIYRYAEKLSESILIWDVLKAYINDQLIQETLNEINKKEVFIANNLTIKDWENLVGIPTNIIIDYKSDKKWDLVFDFFEERIKTRYINPINIILNMELKTGEGFAVVNLQCSLIETIECFINGWIYQKVEKKHVWYNNTSNEIINNNKDIYISFFSEREPFKSFIPKIDGANFYIDVRCALLHEAQTKNGWRILASGTSYPIEQKNIYRNDFQKAILRVIKDYKKAVVYCEKFGRIDGVDLRKNFIKKFNHICEVS